MPERIRGVWCATLTPIDTGGAPAAAVLAAHVQRLFAAGVDGIALFGTTGEGQSFSVAQRRDGLEALIAAGVPARRIVAGTGCAALADVVELSRHAIDIGCAGELVLPPFFFKGLSDEGIYSSYARLIDGVGNARFRLYLYHIPQISGVPIPHDVISRLATTYPGVLAGIKDSGGDFAHTRSLLERFRTLSIFVGHEPHLPPALAIGGAGTICGIANLYPRLIRRLYDHAATPRVSEDLARVGAFIALLDRVPIFAAFKALLADLSGDASWDALCPPLVSMDRDARRALIASVARTGIVASRDAA
jgi:4-hydroxy-tetrahydrodipicolinate synthase